MGSTREATVSAGPVAALPPDKYGFGSGSTNATLVEIRDAVRGLTHYIVVDLTNRNGQAPPPRIPKL